MTVKNIIGGKDHHDQAVLFLEERIKEELLNEDADDIISISHSIAYNPENSGSDQNIFGVWIASAIIVLK
jgi:hypothetical protein